MNTLFLAWQDPNSRAWFPVGRLTFDGAEYEFVYTRGAEEAKKKNFQLVYAFPDLDKVYRSTELFPLFSNRLMRRSRADYKDYIEWLNIPQHQDDPIAILARSGGRKATDHFEVFPCPEVDENGSYHIHFFAHGLRHLPECSIQKINQLQTDDLLYLTHDFQNPYDPNALLLKTLDHYILGYCPRYLVDDVLKLVNKNSELVKVQVERVNLAPTPIQLRLLCNLTAEWSEEFHPFSSQMYQPLAAISKAYTTA